MKFYRIHALLLKYWYISINSVERMFDLFYWPILAIIIFGFTTNYIKEIANFPSIIIFLIGGLITWMLFERISQDIGVFLLEDFWSNNVANSFITPVKESEIFASVAILGLLRSVLSFTVMFLISLFLWKFNFFIGGFSSLFYVIPLFITAWGVGIFVAGMIFRYGTRIQIFAWSVTYLMQPIAAVYYPLETLPNFLQIIAHMTPLMYIFEGYRAGINGVFLIENLFISIGLAIVYFVIGYLYFVKSIKSSKKSGLLTRH